MKKLLENNVAQGQSFLFLLLFILILFVSFTYGEALGIYFGYVLEPLIGFGGNYPILTLFCAGVIVTLLSSSLTNFFTDWKTMSEAQETGRAFQKEVSKARREGNTNRVNKLIKMQPQIMKKQTEAQSGAMKPMIFLMIFIVPIFMWLRGFLGQLDYFHFTVPWAEQVSFFTREAILMQNWLLLYIVFTMVFGQLIRQSFKVISLSDWWKDFKQKLRPSTF